LHQQSQSSSSLSILAPFVGTVLSHIKLASLEALYCNPFYEKALVRIFASTAIPAKLHVALNYVGFLPNSPYFQQIDDILG